LYKRGEIHSSTFLKWKKWITLLEYKHKLYSHTNQPNELVSIKEAVSRLTINYRASVETVRICTVSVVGRGMIGVVSTEALSFATQPL